MTIAYEVLAATIANFHNDENSTLNHLKNAVKIQHDIYVGAINDLLRTNAVFFDVVTRTAQDTATSLRDREAMTT